MNNILIDWCDNIEEKSYRESGCVKTLGTVFQLPPTNIELVNSFTLKFSKQSSLSTGARSLSKHFFREASRKKNININWKHPYWNKPYGSESVKNSLALDHLMNLLDPSIGVWRNLYLLNSSTLIYEIRNNDGYGMRWNIRQGASTENLARQGSVADIKRPNSSIQPRDISFRGFVEPN